MNLKDNEHFNLINSAMPHIGKKLELFWGNPEFPPYFNQLLNDTRDGARQGFPIEVANALFKLSELHDELYPQFCTKVTDVWAKINHRD